MNDGNEISTNVTIIERGYCGSQFNALHNTQHMCILHNHTVQCYGNALDLQRIKAQRAQHVRQIIFCGWHNETFDPMILTKFTKLKAFHMEYGDIQYMVNEFPQLNHLQVRPYTVRKR